MSAKQQSPYLTIQHNDVTGPQYTQAELDGLKIEAARIVEHIKILEEEVKNKRAQLSGLEKLILENPPNL